MGVMLYCTGLVLLIISLLMGFGLYRHLRYSVFQSTILGLLLSVPILIWFILDGLQIITLGLVKVACILGGTDTEEIRGKAIAYFIGKNLPSDQG